MFTVTKDTELRLVDTVGSINNEAASWRAVCFYFDQLMEQYRSEYQIQIAVNLLSDLLIAHQGGVFVCFDRTIMLLCRNITKAQLDKAIFQLRYLFMDDPLAYDAGGDENPEFCHIYDLGVEYAEFYQLCRKKLSQNTRIEQSAENAQRNASGELSLEAAVRSFTPTRLAHVEYDLNKADMSRVFRRQPICAVTAEYDVRKVFDEYYIHINHLRQMLRTEADFFSNRWLFRYLTQLLDARMLDMLMSSPVRYFETPVSLNFNIETILSRRFKEFDAVIKPSLKVSVVVEIHIGDVFSDMRAIKNCGPNRVILCRCDTRQAVSYGQAMGINLYQGRFLDRVLNPNQKVEN
jgi:hypothetical protein